MDVEEQTDATPNASAVESVVGAIIEGAANEAAATGAAALDVVEIATTSANPAAASREEETIEAPQHDAISTDGDGDDGAVEQELEELELPPLAAPPDDSDMQQDEAAGGEEQRNDLMNLLMDDDDEDEDDDDDDDFVLNDNNVDDEGAVPIRDGPRTILIHASRVEAAVRELMEQSRRTEGGVASLINRGFFMQRLRHLMFTLHHNRMPHLRRGGRGNGSGGSGSGEDSGDHNMDAESSGEGNAAGAAASMEDENAGGSEERVEVEVEPENPIRFDTNLPAEHSYMGDNMARVSGVNYLDVGNTYSMMLFMHQHILFPGEVLPFMISGTIIESDIDATNGLLFGICFPFLTRGNGTGNGSGSDNEKSMYGVTCQIYEKGVDEAGKTLIKSRALQRFVTNGSVLTGPLQFIAAHPQMKCYGSVEILPEIYLAEPLKCINMGSMNRFRDNESMQRTFRNYQAATTVWPAHVYDYYSIAAIVEKARTQLAQHKIDTMPTEPVQLSFWLVRNLHLSESMMKTIFMTDVVNTRMKLISSTFKEESMFTCRYCGNRIANCRELFAMSKHGVQTQYCNSAGYIHETNTVYQLLRDAVSHNGKPSSEFSWFPGYQWHIIVCKICSRHIGWEFKALQPNLVPKSFFGISSSSVRISAAMNVPSDPRALIYRSLLSLARRDI